MIGKTSWRRVDGCLIRAPPRMGSFQDGRWIPYRTIQTRLCLKTLYCSDEEEQEHPNDLALPRRQRHPPEDGIPFLGSEDGRVPTGISHDFRVLGRSLAPVLGPKPPHGNSTALLACPRSLAQSLTQTSNPGETERFQGYGWRTCDTARRRLEPPNYPTRGSLPYGSPYPGSLHQSEIKER